MVLRIVLPVGEMYCIFLCFIARNVFKPFSLVLPMNFSTSVHVLADSVSVNASFVRG